MQGKISEDKILVIQKSTKSVLEIIRLANGYILLEAFHVTMQQIYLFKLKTYTKFCVRNISFKDLLHHMHSYGICRCCEIDNKWGKLSPLNICVLNLSDINHNVKEACRELCIMGKSYSVSVIFP